MYSEILLTLDGSPMAEAAIPHARALARAFEARVTLFSVVEIVSIHPQPGIVAPMVGPGVNIEMEMDQARDYLQSIAGQLKAEGIQVRSVVREGDAASQICDYAAENASDIIVMSTHGRSGLQRWVYGSVADRVLRGAEVPVLLIRSHTE